MSNLTGGAQSSTNIQQRLIEPFNLPDTVLESLFPDKKSIPGGMLIIYAYSGYLSLSVMIKLCS